jgi:hypothetical protein
MSFELMLFWLFAYIWNDASHGRSVLNNSEQIVFLSIKTFVLLFFDKRGDHPDFIDTKPICVNFCSQKPLLPAFESVEMRNLVETLLR